MAIGLKDLKSNKSKTRSTPALLKKATKRPWETFDEEGTTRTVGANNAILKAKQIASRNQALDFKESIQTKKEAHQKLIDKSTLSPKVLKNKTKHGISSFLKFLI